MTAEPVRSFTRVDTPAETDREPSLLDQLRQVVTKQVRSEPVVLPIPGRPGLTVRYRTDIGFSQLEKWRKVATGPGKKEPNPVVVYALLLANCCEALILNGQEIVEDGVPFTFSTGFDVLRGWVEETGRPVKAVHELVAALYDSDADILAAGDAVMAAGRWGQEAAEADGDGAAPMDPTPGL